MNCFLSFTHLCLQRATRIISSKFKGQVLPKTFRKCLPYIKSDRDLSKRLRTRQNQQFRPPKGKVEDDHTNTTANDYPSLSALTAQVELAAEDTKPGSMTIQVKIAELSWKVKNMSEGIEE